jgi:hypothetical protein
MQVAALPLNAFSFVEAAAVADLVLAAGWLF